MGNTYYQLSIFGSVGFSLTWIQLKIAISNACQLNDLMVSLLFPFFQFYYLSIILVPKNESLHCILHSA